MNPNVSQLNTDLAAIIATMPEALSLLATNIPTTKPALSAGDLPLLMNIEQMNTMNTLSYMIMQQQQMMGMNPLLLAGLSTGSIPGLDAFSLANLARPLSQSAIPSPKQSLVTDMRPRAFSSAATLQPGDKRRKRSAQDDFAPIGPIKMNSVLRGLVETEEEPIAMQLAPPTRSEDERIAQDIRRVLSRSRPEPQTPERSQENGGVVRNPRRIIRDEDLPDSVGPDSPFRHHPKFQKKNFGLDKYIDDDTDAVACAVASGIWAPMHSGASSDANSSAGNSPKTSDYANNNSPKSFHDMLDQTLARELVAAE